MTVSGNSSQQAKPQPYSWRLGDLLTAILVAGFGLYFLWAQNSSGTSASQLLITKGGEQLSSYYLDKDRFIELKDFGVSMVLEVKDRRVRVASSDCRQQLCVRHGWISRPKEALLCLPNQITVELTGEDAEYDAISR